MNFASLSPATRNSDPRRQRGIITAMAAVILIAAVLFVLQQTYGIIGTTSDSNNSQSDSIAAFFLAESGIDVGRSVLASSTPNLASACTDLSNASVPNGSLLGRGRFTLAGVPAPSGCMDTCISCTLVATGLVGAASRSIEVVLSVSAPNGGASGCGGGGVNFNPSFCSSISPPVPGPYYPSISQNIRLTTTDPVILLSTVGFVRHPDGSSNDINASTCTTNPTAGAGPCNIQWNTESSNSSGNAVVGSRGAAIRIQPLSAPIDYVFDQTLTNDSFFVGIAGKFGGTPVTVGNGPNSYWDDQSKTTGIPTVGSSATGGQTNNGAACSSGCTSGTPPSTIPTTTPPYPGNKQAGTGWCYGADTLVYGFVGKSQNNYDGQLTSFKLGSSPESHAIDTPGITPAGTVSYPRPVTGVINSKIYATLRWIHNPWYVSPTSNASSGASVSASAGIPVGQFVASTTAGGTTLAITSMATSYKISVGDELWCKSGWNCTGGSAPYKIGDVTSTDSILCPGNVPCNCNNCSFGITAASRTTDGAHLPQASDLEIRSNKLVVSSFGATNQWLSRGDYLTINNTPNPTLTITDMPAVLPSGCLNNANHNTCNQAGVYSLSGIVSPPFMHSTNNVVSNGYTVHVASISGSPPAAATIVEARMSSGGKVAAYDSTANAWTVGCVASSPAPEVNLFYLNKFIDTNNKITVPATNCPETTGGISNRWIPAIRLANNELCGGICAFFNQTPGENTQFTLNMPRTDAWASGMTCLSGIDTGSIEGLVGTTPSVTATSWREQVR